MIEFLFAIIACTMAVRLVLMEWFTEASFAGWRARLEARDDSNLLKRLLLCSFCMSFQLSWVLPLAYLVAAECAHRQGYERGQMICCVIVATLATFGLLQVIERLIPVKPE